MKLIAGQVFVDNSSIQSSLEKANLQITSPTGCKIWLYKKKLSTANEDLQKVFWKFCQDPMVCFQGVVECSILEMKQLLEFSKL